VRAAAEDRGTAPEDIPATDVKTTYGATSRQEAHERPGR
jgi:hypothetical protein